MQQFTPLNSELVNSPSPKSVKSSLISRNITISGKRTSVRLEPEMWDALRDIATLEHCSIHQLCTRIEKAKLPNTSMTAAIRVYLMMYYRRACLKEVA